MSTKEELLKRLSEGVLEMEEDDVAGGCAGIYRCGVSGTGCD